MSTEILPRWTVMDGEYHVEGDCCRPGDGLGRTCRVCGSRVHTQPVYAGIFEVCERCNDHDWQPGPPPKPAGAFT